MTHGQGVVTKASAYIHKEKTREWRRAVTIKDILNDYNKNVLSYFPK